MYRFKKGKALWNSFVAVARGYLGHEKAENYAELVETLVKNCGTMDCRMSLNVHVLDAHLDNMGAYLEEQGERLHQYILHFQSPFNVATKDSIMRI